MTHLRKMMLEELERRNYAQTTISSYIRTIEDFARYFRRPPDQLTPEHIREYQAYLFRERKLAASTVTQRLAALRFFYTRTIKKPWSVADTPYPKKTRHLPSILGPQEVAHLIDSSQTRFHRVVLMTLYGTGVRRAELTRLQIPDIDSRRMVIHIRGGKGRQDRDVMLSPRLLEGHYTHRVAISNHRLVSSADGQVTFRWRDSAHHNEHKLMTLAPDEFLRRFLLHTLPKGFVRIRHFGFLANRRRAALLPLCFQLLGAVPQPQVEQQASPAKEPRPLWRCPQCGGPMVVLERLTAAQLQLRSPPWRAGAAA